LLPETNPIAFEVPPVNAVKSAVCNGPFGCDVKDRTYGPFSFELLELVMVGVLELKIANGLENETPSPI
jgi:hypothetical protein